MLKFPERGSKWMMTWDERVILWRFQHLKVVERIIGGSAIGTQGTPVEVLGKRIDVRFFPELWTVATRLPGAHRSARTVTVTET